MCRLDPAASRCIDCRYYPDCVDEWMCSQSLPAPPLDGPIKVLRRRARGRIRNRTRHS